MPKKVYLSSDLRQCCEEYCKAKGLSFSSWVRGLIIAELSRRGRIVKDGSRRMVVLTDK